MDEGEIGGLVVSVVLILSGALVIALGWMGRVGRLKRNRWAGIRLPSTMKSDTAWLAAHRAGWVPTALAGLLSIAGGVVVLFREPEDQAAIVLPTALAVVVVALIGVVVGHVAARKVDE